MLPRRFKESYTHSHRVLHHDKFNQNENQINRTLNILSLVDVVAVKRILANNFWCLPVGMMYDRLIFLAVEKLKPTKTGDDVYAMMNVVTLSSSYPSAPLVEQSNTLYPDLSTEMTVN